MVKINLIPKEEKRETRGLGQFVLGCLIVLAALAAVVAHDISQTKKLEAVNGQIARVKQEISGLEEIKNKVEEFKAKNKELEQRIDIISVLEENRVGPLFVMDALGGSMPERAWLDKFSESRYVAKVEGVAWNELTVSELMKKLQSSPYFRNVELSAIKTKEIQKLPLKTFLITSSLNYSGKTPKEESENNVENGKREARR